MKNVQYTDTGNDFRLYSAIVLYIPSFRDGEDCKKKKVCFSFPLCQGEQLLESS